MLEDNELKPLRATLITLHQLQIRYLGVLLFIGFHYCMTNYKQSKQSRKSENNNHAGMKTHEQMWVQRSNWVIILFGI